MQETKILEGNKLIAEFMGWKSNHNHLPLTNKYNHGNFEIWIDFNTDPIMCSDLKYHLLWDWLMPVVEKIEGMMYWVNMVGKEVWIQDEKLDTIIEPLFGSTKIEAIWQTVVEFIEWYNSKK